jgi:hypothetical protein
MKQLFLIFFTAMGFCGMQAQTNLLNNGDMEAWTCSGDACSPLPNGYVAGGTGSNYANAFARTASAHTGSNALKVYHKTGDSGAHVRFRTDGTALTEGIYTIRFYLKGAGMLRWVRVTNSPSVTPDTPHTVQAISPTEYLKQKTYSDWTLCSASYVATAANTCYIHFSFTGTDDPENNPLLLDDITLTKNENTGGNEEHDRNDARLSGITIENVSDVEWFDKDKDTYTCYLPYTATEIPVITSHTYSPEAVVSGITNPVSLTGNESERKATIEVTAADGSTVKNYYIVFEVLPELDLFLCIGQSNMAGRGYMDAGQGDLDPISEAYLLTPAGQWEIAANPLNRYSNIRKDISMQRISPAYGFARNIIAKTGRKIGLVVNAQGGSNISNWAKGMPLYDATIPRAKDARKWGKYRAILWHQGESNSGASSVTAYPNQLKAMVNNFRTDLGDNTLFFVAGELAYWRGNGTGSAAFNAMIDTIAAFLPYSGCVSASGMTDASYMLIDASDPHFSRKGQLELGKRYADAVYAGIYGKTGIEPLKKDGLPYKIRPAREQVIIETEEPVQCLIADITGRIIARQSINGSASIMLSRGLYIVSLNNPLSILNKSFKIIIS